MPAPAIFVRDRDVDRNGVYDEAGGVRTVFVAGNVALVGDYPSAFAFSGNGRHVVYRELDGSTVVVDRDSDRNGVFDEGPPRLYGLLDRHFGVGDVDVSATGRYVTLGSAAACTQVKLPLGGTVNDCARTADIQSYVVDRDSDNDAIFDEPGTVKMTPLSISTTGVAGNGESDWPSISTDGRLVSYTSEASNLVSGDTNGGRDIFVRDRDGDRDGIFDEPGPVTTMRASVASDGAQMSSDGQFVLPSAVDHTTDNLGNELSGVFFPTNADGLIPGEPAGTVEVYLRSRLT
jgi:hypothetical protein